jgi:hypothetical protein
MPADIWSLVSPFVAAGTAVFLARRQDRERISCFVAWGLEWDDERGPFEWPYIGLHNQSPKTVAITSVRYLTGSFPRKAVEGTALMYEDPFDLDFPYKVESGQIRTVHLDEEMGKRIVADASRFWSWVNVLLRRPRIVVECVTTGGTKLKASAEKLLPWDERQRWARA